MYTYLQSHPGVALIALIALVTFAGAFTHWHNRQARRLH